MHAADRHSPKQCLKKRPFPARLTDAHDLARKQCEHATNVNHVGGQQGMLTACLQPDLVLTHLTCIARSAGSVVHSLLLPCHHPDSLCCWDDGHACYYHQIQCTNTYSRRAWQLTSPCSATNCVACRMRLASSTLRPMPRLFMVICGWRKVLTVNYHSIKQVICRS